VDEGPNDEAKASERQSEALERQAKVRTASVSSPLKIGQSEESPVIQPF